MEAIKVKKYFDLESFSNEKVYTYSFFNDLIDKTINTYYVELNILNSLISSQNVESDFIKIIKEYPRVNNVVPLLLEKRAREIMLMNDSSLDVFRFTMKKYSLKQYIFFMDKFGLFSLLKNHKINNLIDYLRNNNKMETIKNEYNAMKDLTESYLVKAGLVLDKTYFKDLTIDEIEDKFKVDLSNIKDNGIAKFDLVFLGPISEVYALNCNFFEDEDKDLTDIFKNYRMLFENSKDIVRFKPVWLIDGRRALMNYLDDLRYLYENFDLYNINNLENGIIDELISLKSFDESL